jgi:hypothetical protein
VGDVLLVALPGHGERLIAGVDGHVDQAGDVRADDLSDSTLDLLPCFVVAATESVPHAREFIFCLHQRPLARSAHLRGFF